MLPVQPALDGTQAPTLRCPIVQQAAEQLGQRGRQLFTTGQGRKRTIIDLRLDDLLIGHAGRWIAPEMQHQQHDSQGIKVIRLGPRPPSTRQTGAVLNGFEQNVLAIARWHAEAFAEHNGTLIAQLIEQIIRSDGAMRRPARPHMREGLQDGFQHLLEDLALGEQWHLRLTIGHDAFAARPWKYQRWPAPPDRLFTAPRYWPVNNPDAAWPEHVALLYLVNRVKKCPAS